MIKHKLDKGNDVNPKRYSKQVGALGFCGKCVADLYLVCMQIHKIWNLKSWHSLILNRNCSIYCVFTVQRQRQCGLPGGGGHFD